MEKLTIKNFRNIDESLSIDLAPITILTGANNSGKSNLIKMLVVLNDYFAGEDYFSLPFTGPNAGKHKIDCYQNAIHDLNWASNKVLEFSYDRNDYRIRFKFEPLIEISDQDKHSEIQKGKLAEFEVINMKNDSRISLKLNKENDFDLSIDKSIVLSFITTFYEGKHKNAIIDQREDQINEKMSEIRELMSANEGLDVSDELHIKNIEKVNTLYRHIRDLKRDIEYLNGDEKDILSVKGTIKSVIKSNSLKKKGDRYIPFIITRSIQSYMDQAQPAENEALSMKVWSFNSRKLSINITGFLSISTIHMSPDRSHQTRIHSTTSTDSDISEIFASVGKTPFMKDGVADIFIKKWMDKFNIGEEYRIRDIEGIASAFEVRDKNGWRNLVDKGFGSGQVLPIILQLGRYLGRRDFNESSKRFSESDYPPIFVFEEPEANLHPAFQSLLAEMFHEATKDRYIRIIIETHSEYLIRKLKLLRAKKELKEDEVLIYYIYSEGESRAQDQTRIEKIKILENGKLSHPFGPGFFDAADDIELELYRLNRNKS